MMVNKHKTVSILDKTYVRVREVQLLVFEKVLVLNPPSLSLPTQPPSNI